ncbi:M20/M25/M40 family metallo-hydrolase [Mailhella massiliensis]|uniref:M20/M25/M40 family metallo-hydrolase n=1 Tax=Mailhella massiliensis TaxID=1903261 RepID=UPI00097DC0B1|nr:M20/M25/M40 family metallo-hydrolase [Mailhella massiliensis]
MEEQNEKKQYCCGRSDGVLAAPACGAEGKKDEALHEACRNAVPEYVELFKSIINIDSGSEDVKGLNRKKDFLVDYLKKLGAEVETVEAAGDRKGTSNIIARIRGKGKARILLCSHYDTVWPAGEAAARPFRMEEGRMFGPGAGDTQSGVAGSIIVLRILKTLNYDDFNVITLFLNADEKLGSAGAKEQLLREAARHDVAFSTEGGGADGESVAVSCRGGSDAVLTVKGKRAHSGRPHLGHNAGVELVRQINNMLDLADKEKRTDCTWTMGSFGTNTNVVPDSATAVMDIRAASLAEFERVKTELMKRSAQVTDKGCTVELKFTLGKPPFEYSSSTAVLADAAERIYAELGRTLVKMHVPASSDANWISQEIPTLEGLGISNANPHQKDEFSSVKPAPDRFYLLARLIQETCRGNTVPLGE